MDPDENFFNEIFGGLELRQESNYYSINRYNSTFNNSSSYLDIFAYNIRSFDRNNGSFIAMLKSFIKPPEIIVLTETWLTAEEQDVSLLDVIPSIIQ